MKFIKSHLIIIVTFFILFSSFDLAARHSHGITNKLEFSKLNSCSNRKKMIWGWLTKVLNALAKPFNPEWGSYIVSGQNSTSPIVLFNRSTFEVDKNAIINQIKIDNSDFNKVYGNIFDSATQHSFYTIPSSSFDPKNISPRARYAKNAAFVVLMGVDDCGDPLTTTNRDFLAAHVLEVLNHVDDIVADLDINGKGFFNTTKWDDWGDRQFNRSQELINYCIAMDLLKTAGYTWEHNRNSHDNPVRALKEFTHELYSFADRPFNTLHTLKII